MTKMGKCRYCGAVVTSNAKQCPQCGAKFKSPVLGIVLVVVGILLFVMAFGGISENTPKKADRSKATSIQSALPTETEEPKKTSFSVGESAELRNVVVTLNSVKESMGSQFNHPTDGNVFLICDFTIENNSENEISVSSLLSFEAYADGYSTSMSLTATIQGDKQQLDGKVAPEKKMNGIIGYEVPADYKELEVNFTPSFWNGSKMKFVYQK